MSKKDIQTDKEVNVEDAKNNAVETENAETSTNDAANDTAEEAVEEKDPIEVLSTQVAQEKDRYLRLFAEFENYKKRTSKERVELFKTAGQDIIVAMLPVLDDFDRALKEFSDDQDDIHVQGMALISSKLKETLKQKGLELAETNAGDTFDADIHEAITQIPAPSDDMKGKIIDIIEKGYKLGEKIIRYPKVVIGQ